MSAGRCRSWARPATEPSAPDRTGLDAPRSRDARHEGLERIHVFPAVPAPVAVAMGWELLPKRDPAFLVFDFNKKQGGFQPTLEVNPA